MRPAKINWIVFFSVWPLRKYSSCEYSLAPASTSGNCGVAARELQLESGSAPPVSLQDLFHSSSLFSTSSAGSQKEAPAPPPHPPAAPLRYSQRPLKWLKLKRQDHRRAAAGKKKKKDPGTLCPEAPAPIWEPKSRELSSRQTLSKTLCGDTGGVTSRGKFPTMFSAHSCPVGCNYSILHAERRRRKRGGFNQRVN